MYTQWGGLSQGRKMNALQEEHKIKPDLSTLNIQSNSLKQPILPSSVLLSFFFYYYKHLEASSYGRPFATGSIASTFYNHAALGNSLSHWLGQRDKRKCDKCYISYNLINIHAFEA